MSHGPNSFTVQFFFFLIRKVYIECMAGSVIFVIAKLLRAGF